MKKLLFAIILCAGFAAPAFGQSSPPITVTEVDGSPRVNGVTKIVVSNGSLTVSGKTATIVTGGGGGGGCTPPGTLSRVLYDDGAGGCTSTSGLTATATTITIVNGVTATFSRAGVLYTGTVTTDNSSVQTMLLQGDRATVASNDEAYVTYRLSNAAGTQTEVARMTWAIPTATAAAENGRLDFSVMTAGALAKELQLAGDDLSPSTSDGLALGTVSLPWSDIFLATGAIIDFANNDSRITHSSGVLTISAGDLRVTTAGTNAASVATLNGTQSFQSKTITNSNNVLGGVTMTLGSDADGDTYYRASNVLTRLAKGTAGQCFQMNGGATAPTWGSCGGASGITIGTTTVTSGTGGRFIYETTGNVVGEISTLTSDGTIVTFSPTVTTGTGATSGLNATANSLTTGTAFHFSSSSITSGSIVNIASTSTAGATGVKGLNIAMSGANAASGQTIAGATISVTNTNATSGTNVGLSIAASGATTENRAIYVSAGQVSIQSGSASVPSIGLVPGLPNYGIYYAGGINFTIGGTQIFKVSSAIIRTNSSGAFGFTSTSDADNGTTDLQFRRLAAASLVQGAVNSATPVANLFTIGESSRGGTDSNVAGANGTIQAGLGTGTGGGGSLIFRTGTPGSTGTTANSYATALTINAAGHLIVTGTAPAIASGFGTSPSIAGADHAGRVTVGTGGTATTGAITFGQAFATAPACTVNNETTVLLAQATATTTTLTITSATPFTASDKLTYVCLGY
jgi:hypothetical protein